MSSSGAALPLISPFYLQCTVMASLASSQASFHLLEMHGFFDPEVHLACYSLNNSGFSYACGGIPIFKGGFIPDPE